jgi:hypothetical protein
MGFLQALEYGHRRVRAFAFISPASGIRKMPRRKKILQRRMTPERRLRIKSCPQSVPREFKWVAIA